MNERIRSCIWLRVLCIQSFECSLKCSRGEVTYCTSSIYHHQFQKIASCLYFFGYPFMTFDIALISFGSMVLNINPYGFPWIVLSFRTWIQWYWKSSGCYWALEISRVHFDLCEQKNGIPKSLICSLELLISLPSLFIVNLLIA